MPVFFLWLIFLWVVQDSPPVTVSLQPESPVEGQTATLTFAAGEVGGAPVPGLAVAARYREKADETLRSTQEIGTTNAQGQLEWIPEQAGVVVLAWEGGTKNVPVKHDGNPPMAILIAVLAGLFLLGGSVVFFIQMLKQGGTAFED